MTLPFLTFKYAAQIAQLNCHKCKSATLALLDRFQKRTLLACLQEPYSYKGKIPGVGPHQVVHAAVPRPRAAMVASPDLNLWFHAEFSDSDICTAILRAQTPATDVYVASVYLDISRNGNAMFPPQLVRLVEFCSTNRHPLVLCLDANAHSHLWSDSENFRGRALEEFISRWNLTVENVGTLPTFHTRVAATVIDITLSLNSSVSEWQVSDTETLSDHRMITFSLPEVVSSKTKVHNLRKTDWEAFYSYVETACADSSPPHSISRAWIDSETLFLVQTLTRAAHANSPVVVIPSRAKPPSCFTAEIREARSHANSLYKRYRRDRSPTAWDDYARQRSEVQRLIRRAKRASWRQFTSSASHPKDVAKLVKCVQQRLNSRVDLLATKNSPQESLSCLFDTHFPGCRPVPTTTATAPAGGPAPARRSRSPLRQPPTPVPRSRSEGSRRGTSCTRWGLVDVPLITPEKVLWSIKAFGPHKAAGDDGISPIMLQNCGPLFIQRLVHLYKAILFLAYTPESMRRSKVIFIPKAGKPDYTVPKAFRPISLTSVLFKVLERVVLDSLQQPVVDNMNRRQHAFRKGSSCDSALSAMADRIERHIMQNEFALGVFLDIAGAFDNLSFQAAIQGLERAGVDPLIVAWYSQYLRNRTAWADLKGCSLLVHLVKGTPQGGVLSPIIWNLAFESFLNLFFFGPVHSQAFADDGALLTGGPDPSALVRNMQRALDKVWEWSEAIGLAFSPSKTEAIVFTRRNGPYLEAFPALTFGLPLTYVPQIKYLGVIFDRRLTYKAHIRAQCVKGTRLLKAVQNAIGKLWGPSPLALKWAYEMMVKPMLLYGAVVWGFHASGVVTPLQRVQRLAMLCCGFFLKSTPTKGLEIIFHFPPPRPSLPGGGPRSGPPYPRAKSPGLGWDGQGGPHAATLHSPMSTLAS